VLGAVGMLQVMLQGTGPVGYYLQVLKGVMSAGCYAYRAFCSWVRLVGAKPNLASRRCLASSSTNEHIAQTF
jgi:hypothetical protein